MVIPLVDLKSDAETIISTIQKAMKTIGCFYLKNHGIPKDLVESISVNF